MNLEAVRTALDAASAPTCHEAAVLIPLLEDRAGLQVLFEVRAHTLAVQPGEVCLPGGSIEEGETPRETALRETCEELLVTPDQIQLIGSLGPQPGPGGRPLHVFVGTIRGYEGSYATDEVDHTFTLSLDWLMSHPPRVYRVALEPHYPDDFPWESVPRGRAYAWRAQVNHVPFYHGTDPVLWGATARVIDRFTQLLSDREDAAR